MLSIVLTFALHGLTYLPTSASQRKSQEQEVEFELHCYPFPSRHCPPLLPPSVPPLCLYSIWCHQLYPSHVSCVCPSVFSSLLSWQHHCITFSGLDLALTSKSNITHNPSPLLFAMSHSSDETGERGPWGWRVENQLDSVVGEGLSVI